MSKFWRSYQEDKENWRDEAKSLLASVIRYIEDHRKSRRKRISTEEYLAERKLIFLLDDLQAAISHNDPSSFETLVTAINKAWVELYEIRMLRSKK